MHDANVVTNFKNEGGHCQGERFYNDVMKQEAEKLAEKYIEVNNRLESFTEKLSSYDRLWNKPLWKQAENLQEDCENILR